MLTVIGPRYSRAGVVEQSGVRLNRGVGASVPWPVRTGAMERAMETRALS